MKKNWVWIVIFLLAMCSSMRAQSSSGKAVPCDSQIHIDGWHTYVDRVHGFCFCYPPSYKRLPSAKKHIIKFKSLHSDAYIFVWFENELFDLQRFVKSAPTGYDSPPAPV